MMGRPRKNKNAETQNTAPVVSSKERKFDYQYLVSNSGNINTRRGILPPGEVLTADDFESGTDALEDNVKTGSVLKRKVFIDE
jgi:hypothetical protein